MAPRVRKEVRARTHKTMDIESIHETPGEFRILQTRHHTQTAVIRLEPGGSTGGTGCHDKSEQVVFVVEGEFTAEVGDDTRVVTKGESLVIGEGVKHRLSNARDSEALAFTVYAPPVYAPALPKK